MSGRINGDTEWVVTPWKMGGDGTWALQPVILLYHKVPYYADHPSAYIAELERMHDDPTLVPGPFWKCIGELKDALDQNWDKEGLTIEESNSRNGNR